MDEMWNPLIVSIFSQQVIDYMSYYAWRYPPGPPVYEAQGDARAEDDCEVSPGAPIDREVIDGEDCPVHEDAEAGCRPRDQQVGEEAPEELLLGDRYQEFEHLGWNDS